MDEPTRLPVLAPEREPLTEAEARRIGESAHQLARLRGVLAHTPLSAQVAIRTNSGGGASLNLNQLDIEAVLGLLMEREAMLLASFNVAVEPPHA